MVRLCHTQKRLFVEQPIHAILREGVGVNPIHDPRVQIIDAMCTKLILFGMVGGQQRQCVQDVFDGGVVPLTSFWKRLISACWTASACSTDTRSSPRESTGLVERVHGLACVPILFRSRSTNLRNDVTIEDAVRKRVGSMLQDGTELSGVVRIEDQFVVLEARIDPFVESFPVFDLVADADRPDVGVHFATLAGTREAPQEFVVVELVDLVETRRRETPRKAPRRYHGNQLRQSRPAERLGPYRSRRGVPGPSRD